MAKLITEIKLTELDQTKTLFELFADNIDCMQEPLKSKFLEWVNSEDKGWTTWSDISPEFIGNMSCVVLVDDVVHLFVTGYNKILRKVKIYNDELKKVEVFNAKSFSIKNIGSASFVEWS